MWKDPGLLLLLLLLLPRGHQKLLSSYSTMYSRPALTGRILHLIHLPTFFSKDVLLSCTSAHLGRFDCTVGQSGEDHPLLLTHTHTHTHAFPTRVRTRRTLPVHFGYWRSASLPKMRRILSSSFCAFRK